MAKVGATVLLAVAVATAGCGDSNHRHTPRHPILPSCEEIGSAELGEALGAAPLTEYPASDDSLNCGSDGGWLSVNVMEVRSPQVLEYPPFDGLEGATGGIIGSRLTVRYEPFLIQIAIYDAPANDEALKSALEIVVAKLPAD